MAGERCRTRVLTGFDAPRFELSSAALERRSARMGSFPVLLGDQGVGVL